MEYYYGAMWLVVALILIFKISKENKIFYMLGGFFAVMGLWWIADGYFTDIDLIDGEYGIILKVLGAICLVITVIHYYKNIRTKKEEK